LRLALDLAAEDARRLAAGQPLSIRRFRELSDS
jgi:hypothetical protein